MSDEASDALVDLFFQAFPSVDGPELGFVLDRIMKILDAEIREACRQERRLLMVRANARSKN